jgi:DNA repair exonuclease SbcCD ATPase subunit
MINTLQLTNFRQHRDLTLNFTLGTNCIRGTNESGKSTILSAILYAFFGAKALNQTLEDVVTYDQPVSSLKVQMMFTLHGVEYQVSRGKSGAELTFGRETVTGQTEVTKMVEKLLGANAATAGKLMVAEQNDLRGVLSEGPTATGALIESLADFELIDKLLELVQTLPSGAAGPHESRVTTLEAVIAEDHAQDTTELELAVNDKAGEVVSAETALALAKSLVVDTTEAEQGITLRRQQVAALASLEARADAMQSAATAPIPAAPTGPEVEALRVRVSKQAHVPGLIALNKKLKAANIEPMWVGSLHDLQEAEHSFSDSLAAAQAEVVAANLKISALTGKLIKETTCAFCDKDLTDVPEVVQRNSKLGAEITALTAHKVATQREVAQLAESLTGVRAALKADSAASALYLTCGENITLEAGTVPQVWTWVSDLTLDETLPEQLRTAEAALTAQRGAIALKEISEKCLKELRVEMAELKASTVTADQALKFKELIEEVLSVKVDVHSKTERLALLKQGLSALNGRLSVMIAVNAEKARAKVKAHKDLAEAKDVLTEVQANNVLLKKLRAARPQITDKLWGMVLSAVSSYLTGIRGEPSRVQKGSDGFTVNGRPAVGLSGSAKDALGLAIRVALTKTFLPGSSLLMLDEMAAACDTEREAAMLGMIASCGCPQVIMVSHSDQCEAYSDNVIRIGD